MEPNGDNEWTRCIRSQTSRMTRLVNDLVDLSRMNEELPFPEMTDFSLTDTAWEISEPFVSSAKGKGKTLNCSIADDIQIKGDQKSIQRLISILLDNAVKYSLPDSTIDLTVDTTHCHRRITVQNRCLLPEGFDIARLFDRFYRPDASRVASTGGTGVGLAMAKAIAEAHHGSIRADLPSRNMIRFTVLL